MATAPVTLTHPDTGATYVASTRLELMDALANGWVEVQAQEACPMPTKTSGKKKAISDQAPEESA